jgi:large subunit ribosomal protein L10
MDRKQKQQNIEALKVDFEKAQTAVVAHYRGMTVAEITRLRKAAREAGSSVQVTKNTLAKIASDNTKFSGLKPLLNGPTAIILSEDAVAAAKVVVDFTKDNEKLVIIGGAIDGTVLNEQGVKALADTPSLDASRARIAGLLNAVATKLVCTIAAPAGQVARVVQAYSQKDNK